MVGSTKWLCGLPSSGKTSIAKEIVTLTDAILLDGDDIRIGLNKELSHSNEDSLENVRRVAHIAELLNKQGKHVVCALVTPTTEMRDLLLSIITNIDLFILDTPLQVCEQRDVKGLYQEGLSKKLLPFEFTHSNATSITTKQNITNSAMDILT